MVSHCVAKEVQRNAKWGLLCGKRERAGREKKVSKVEKKSGLDRKRKYHPSLCARVIL